MTIRETLFTLILNRTGFEGYNVKSRGCVIGFEEDRQAAGNMKPEGLDVGFFVCVYEVLYKIKVFEEMNHATSHKLSL